MLTLFGKKRLTEEKVANVFVNAIQTTIDEGFESVVGLIKDSPEFITKPKISEDQSGPFTMIVLAGNLQSIPIYFDGDQDQRIIEHVLEKFSALYEMDKMELAKMVGETRKFMAQKNHPSKNTLNAMAKAIFCRYELNAYQDEYFRGLHAPNPIFIQRLKEALECFIWDWKPITEKFKIVQAD